MSAGSSRDRTVLSASDYEERKAFLQFGEGDAEILRRLGPALATACSRVIERFYEHLFAFPAPRALLSDSATLERLKRAQARYFDRLLAGDYGPAYAQDRLRIGATHHRVGLEPKWYLGAYAFYLRLLLHDVWRAAEAEGIPGFAAFEALLKALFLDMAIAVDAYRAADQRHIAELKRFNERIVASVPAGLLVLDHDFRVVSANRSFVDACGSPGEALIGRPILDVLRVPELEPHLRAVRETTEPRSGLLLSVPRPGSDVRRPVRVAVTRVESEEQEEERLLVLVEDLSEEERLAALARASERRFQQVVENATDGIVLMDTQGLILSFNRAAEQMFGWRRDEVLGKPVTLLMPDRFRDAHDRGVGRYLSSGESLTLGSVRHVEGLRKDGTTFPIECTLSVYRCDGDVVFTGVLRDITERQAAEQALRRSEASFRTLIEQSPDAVAVLRDGRLVYVNPSLVRLLGYDGPDQLIGRTFREVVLPEAQASLVEDLEDLAASPTVRPGVEQRWQRRDGTPVFVEVATIPSVFDGEPAVVALARDSTERRQLATKLMQMDRMIAVGTLAAGVGHELNNPLTYVMASVDLVAQELPDLVRKVRGLLSLPAIAGPNGEVARTLLDIEHRLAECRHVLGEAREGTERLRTIVRDLRTFSRADDDRRDSVDVERVLESAINMAWNEIRHRARLIKHYGATPHVVANESRLGQVFLNLLVNAAHAIAEGQAQRHEIHVRTLADGDRVVVEIRDTGTGIAPDHLPRIFDPFFTTKPIGQGTGLGLAICQGIIRGLGGEIAVESELGKGSCFRVILPVGDVATVEPTRPDPVPAGRRGRLLVVDDEPLVGNSLRRTLAADHDVVVVTSGRAALDLLTAGERFDLILCDLMMPEMTGADLYAELQNSFSEHAAKMIFLTAGAFTPRAREFFARVPNPCVEKPFDAQNLRALVRGLVH